MGRGIWLAVLLMIAGCAQQAAAPALPPVIPDYSHDAIQLQLRKQQTEFQAQERFQRAYIECQEYDFKLDGCAVLQKKRDTDERAALVSATQQKKAERIAAEKLVRDEAAELQKP